MLIVVLRDEGNLEILIYFSHINLFSSIYQAWSWEAVIS